MLDTVLTTAAVVAILISIALPVATYLDKQDWKGRAKRNLRRRKSDN